MAQEQKNTLTPALIPETLLCFMRGFDATSEKEAKAIFESVIKTLVHDHAITKKEIKTCYNLFLIINPQDDHERVWCAQFIISHVLGMRNLVLGSTRDKRIGIKLLKTADEAINYLHNKRKGA